MVFRLDVPDNEPHARLYGLFLALLASLFALGQVGLGLVLAVWPERVNPPSFMYILQAGTPGQWGAAFIAAGVVGLVGQWTHHQWPTRLAHWASCALCWYWGGAFLLAARDDQRAGFTGVVAYGLIIGTAHLITGIAAPHRVRVRSA